jgi:hypothetical protein
MGVESFAKARMTVSTGGGEGRVGGDDVTMRDLRGQNGAGLL